MQKRISLDKEIEKEVLKLVPVEYRLIIFNDFLSFFLPERQEKCLKIRNAELHRNASAWIKRLKKSLAAYFGGI